MRVPRAGASNLARATPPVAEDRCNLAARCRWIRPNGFHTALLTHHSTNILPHTTKFTRGKREKVTNLAVPCWQGVPIMALGSCRIRRSYKARDRLRSDSVVTNYFCANSALARL